MIKGRNSTNILEANEVYVEKKGKKYEVRLPSISAAFQTLLDSAHIKTDNDGNDAHFKDNQLDGEDRHGSNREEFTGASIKDVQKAAKGVFDKEPFRKAKKELQDSFAKIEESLALNGVKRRRFFNEHEGELDFDRIYDRYPFSGARKDRSLIPTLDVVIHCCFSGGVGKTYVNKYGALCWAVVDLLESSGISCNVTMRYVSNNFTDCGKNLQVDVCLKMAGQYSDMLDMARAFTSWFYRRCIFNVDALVGDSHGNTVSSGLGSPASVKCKSHKGYLELAPNIQLDFTNQTNIDHLVKFLKDALGIGAPGSKNQAA